jgi:hypothetical protein
LRRIGPVDPVRAGIEILRRVQEDAEILDDRAFHVSLELRRECAGQIDLALTDIVFVIHELARVANRVGQLLKHPGAAGLKRRLGSVFALRITGNVEPVASVAMHLVHNHQIAAIRNAYGAETGFPAGKRLQRLRLEAVRRRNAAGERVTRDALMFRILPHAHEGAEGERMSGANQRQRAANKKSARKRHHGVSPSPRKRCAAPAFNVNRQ